MCTNITNTAVEVLHAHDRVRLAETAARALGHELLAKAREDKPLGAVARQYRSAMATLKTAWNEAKAADEALLTELERAC
jgi:hypothetical protein